MLPRIADTEGDEHRTRRRRREEDHAAGDEAGRKRLTVKGLPRAAACPRPRRVKIRVSAPKGTKLKSISLFLGGKLRAQG